MKALICVVPGNQGDRIAYLGSGATESAARRAAFEWNNRGRNPYDEEYSGGILMECAPQLAAVLSRPCLGDNRIVFDWATHRLFIRPDGLLDARRYGAPTTMPPQIVNSARG
ncbi:hypothetical protein [Xanthomonas vasicola]|uniref:hypothetical protein n=1 Tax=Xanthomonas vasicola TaxID=56459 RepID=UPI000FF57C91|nr:hypothetical protein [Xanthomonas vasicola]RNK97058.1 hypothetical protein C9407_21580 [Xanthomonas vasicola pv. vasculorum]